MMLPCSLSHFSGAPDDDELFIFRLEPRRTMKPVEATKQQYVLGHSQFEMERLARQAKQMEPITRRGFLAAGLAPGMRVLDIGSGVGDVAFLAASIVGPTGSVTGTDRVPIALETARARAASFKNVSFVQGDPTALSFEVPFDAVVGRYILMFQSDPASFLRDVVRHTKPGGIVAFHEPDWWSARSYPACPVYDRCVDLLRELVRRSGARERMGVELTETFVDAGLPAPKMEIGELIGGSEAATEPAELVADLVISVIGELERYGIASAKEVGAADLYERVLREAGENRSTLVCRSEIVAYANKR
jgi:ubiquinone/menaquinone biosynthesis C-methylase UbiE